MRITFDLIGTRVHPEDLPLMADMIERAQSAASHLKYEHRIVMPNQTIKYLQLGMCLTQVTTSAWVLAVLGLPENPATISS